MKGKTVAGQVDPTINNDRRIAIKKIAMGVSVLAGISMLPEKWTTPIIGQIVLPAHAQTSGVNGSFAATIDRSLGATQKNHQIVESIAKIGESIADFFVADALANGGLQICVTLSGNSATVYIADGALYQSTGTVNGGVEILVDVSNTFDVTFESVSNDAVTVTVVLKTNQWRGTLLPSLDSCGTFFDL